MRSQAVKWFAQGYGTSCWRAEIRPFTTSAWSDTRSVLCFMFSGMFLHANVIWTACLTYSKGHAAHWIFSWIGFHLKFNHDWDFNETLFFSSGYLNETTFITVFQNLYSTGVVYWFKHIVIIWNHQPFDQNVTLNCEEQSEFLQNSTAISLLLLFF